MTRKATKSIKGTELQVGDVRCIGRGELSSTITSVRQGQHPMGAKYQDVTMGTGDTDRCWEGFLYHIICEIDLDLENATHAELAAMP